MSTSRRAHSTCFLFIFRKKLIYSHACWCCYLIVLFVISLICLPTANCGLGVFSLFNLALEKNVSSGLLCKSFCTNTMSTTILILLTVSVVIWWSVSSLNKRSQCQLHWRTRPSKCTIFHFLGNGRQKNNLSPNGENFNPECVLLFPTPKSCCAMTPMSYELWHNVGRLILHIITYIIYQFHL